MGEGEIEDSGYLVDMVGHNLQNGIYTSDCYVCLEDAGSSDTTVEKTYPTTYFLKTNGELDDNKIYPMLLNGRDTEETTDDVPESAKIRVLADRESTEDTAASQTGKAFLRAYVVIDGSTNKPIKGNGKVTGVKNWYIISDNEDASAFITSTTTADIKSSVAYAQKNKDIAYNISDANFVFEDAYYYAEKTIADILSDLEAEHDLKLRSIPVVKDTNDNYVYMDASCYYGAYAYLTPKTSVDASAVHIFSVTGGLKANSYATIQDIGTITEFTTLNSLIPLTYDVSTKASGEYTDTSKGFLFTFDGNDYLVNEDFSVLYKKAQADTPDYFGVNFLSYNYLTNNIGDAISNVYNAYYFNGYENTSDVNQAVFLQDTSLYNADNSVEEQQIPVPKENLNTFIITNEVEAAEISVGDYVNNIVFNNQLGEAESFNLIPGVTRIISKVFVNVDARSEFYYKGKKYKINLGALKNQLIETKSGKRGFYLFTALEPVYISKYHIITRQIPITSDTISHNLKFIPLKGLHISAKHRPGFDEYGKVDIEGGIEKIYSMLEDDGIHRGLCNPNMVDYRYIVDSMSYGLNPELGGKVYLSRLAQDRMKTTALLNLPSKRQFELSQNPCFCETYEQGIYTKPPFDTKYIPMGGNSDLYNTKMFSLPTEDDGSKFSAAFWPHLRYTVNGRNIMVPPAADVCDVLIHKFNGGDPYVIAANRNGIIRNSDVTGVEFMADTEDREYLEPFGVNTIIQERNDVLIYGNQTCYQNIKSDYNKLHVRENLNTLEIACEAVLKSYNFLYNTPAVRASIVTALTPILEAMKLSQALDKYEIVCDESNNTPEIIEQDFGVVDIGVWMNHGMEKIVQRITLNRRDTLSNNE